jgi:hypothetical protein
MRIRMTSQQRFGKLQTAWPVGISKGHPLWLCFCDCGKSTIVITSSLRTGKTKSCGCFERESRSRGNNFRHGEARRGKISKEYSTWVGIWNRCTNPKVARYRYYGGAGIKVCDRWKKFENFLADMGRRPYGTTIGRLGDVGNYEPGNVRWMTRLEQGRERRIKNSNA